MGIGGNSLDSMYQQLSVSQSVVCQIVYTILGTKPYGYNQNTVCALYHPILASNTNLLTILTILYTASHILRSSLYAILRTYFDASLHLGLALALAFSHNLPTQPTNKQQRVFHPPTR